MPTAALAVYLLPAVVGGGRGDIEDLRAVGEALRPAGFPILLPTGTHHALPLPPGEFAEWTFVRLDRHLRRRALRALTVVPQFGICAAPARAGPFGRAGPWADVVDALETSYGKDRVVHVSLEEFARNLSAARQESERLREGGVPTRRIRALRRTPAWARDVGRMRRLWRRYHELDRPNLLSLVPTFVPSRGCRRDFPELLECGPVPPPPERSAPSPPRPPRRDREARWVWYASPSTSTILLDGLGEGSQRAARPLSIAVRTPRPFPVEKVPKGIRWTWIDRASRTDWEAQFRSADLRIVTGSRSLLEALALGGPFLYFHGATGKGPRRRAHRPEKIQNLLYLWRSSGVPRRLRRDLADFARGRGVAGIVERALSGPGWSGMFPPSPIPGRFPPDRVDGGAFLRSIAEGWAGSTLGAAAFVREQRLPRR
ncbi:MAG: hypothetical protein L3K08_02290 [Thermoplasmata archaeon]|nr:hypothetical protein [Thermoplasmata archaeon]